ncbi:MAG: hypothetical protein BWY38_03193 [Ignavibacteria bacterium ADurb.Bin266]|nr:MAG: hypothetical protein BWY38_03193 [Ignavibacteria bacterium ADurb.Bin266]
MLSYNSLSGLTFVYQGVKIIQMNLDITKITSCGSDWETNRYTFLQTIKTWRSEIHQNRLYPAIEYANQLQLRFSDILNENIESKSWLENEVKGTFVDNKLVIIEKAHQISSQLDKLIDFIKWALNENLEILNEAGIVKQFVRDNVDIISCCNKDKYRGKGYILIPDNKLNVYKIYLYDLSINWSIDDPVEYLEMTLLRSIPVKLVNLSLEELMNEFMKNSRTLFDPMIYICKTELDFPFKETVFPIIKEKLLASVNGLEPYL